MSLMEISKSSTHLHSSKMEDKCDTLRGDFIINAHFSLIFVYFWENLGGAHPQKMERGAQNEI